MSRIVLLFALVLALTHNGRADKPKKIALTVYYESKCKASADFMHNQLFRTAEYLRGYFTLKLVPFGLINSINNHECRQTPGKYLVNTLHDCALDAISDRNVDEKVNYIYCEMEEYELRDDSLECVKRLHIPVKEVEECMSTNKGLELQLVSKHATELLDPKFIPTITIDGVFDQDIQDLAVNDLITALCSKLKRNIACVQYFNSRVGPSK